MRKQDKRAKRAKEKAKRARQVKQRQIDSRNTNFVSDVPNDVPALSEPEQYFGYSRERREDESPFELPSEGMLCMVSIINEQNIADIRAETNINFEIGQWFLSENLQDHKFILHGPFDGIEAAFNFGRIELGVISYRTVPVFDGFE
jgi:hypothetical protein